MVVLGEEVGVVEVLGVEVCVVVVRFAWWWRLVSWR